jgi:hypothetical protein
LLYLQPVSKKKVTGKKVAALPANLAQKQAAPKKVSNPLFEKRSKNYGIGECDCDKFEIDCLLIEFYFS